MMPPPDQQPYDDRFLTQYLLGALPAEEAESMDVLCIADEQLATRLAAIENDLVDSYVRGELSGDDLDRFKSFYLSSTYRRQKVDFAAALLESEKKGTGTPVAKPVATAVAASDTVSAKSPLAKPAEPLLPSVVPRSPRRGWLWGGALAAAAIVLIAAYASFDNWRLRRQINDSRTQLATLDQREQQLQNQLDAQRSANAESVKEIERLRQSQTNLEQLTAVSMLLPPPTRAATRPSAITLQPGTNLAVLLLTLEAADFPQYRAVLKDPAADQALWTSGNLQPALLGDKKVVSISFPGNLLKQQNYVVELTGLPGHGAPEPIGSYPFHAVLK
jgi:hypothetical protein